MKEESASAIFVCSIVKQLAWNTLYFRKCFTKDERVSLKCFIKVHKLAGILVYVYMVDFLIYVKDNDTRDIENKGKQVETEKSAWTQ